MDKNTIIGLVLIFAIFIAWSVWMSPSKEDIEKQKRIQDSLVMVQMRKDSLNQALETTKEIKNVLPVSMQPYICTAE
jgi:YidC/Oxa1 family membrane protein insertase